MTLWASRDGQKVTIHGNINLDVKIQASYVAEFAVTEDALHVKSLWGSLGRLIEEAEAERAASTQPDPVHEPERGGF